jgi:hypothetical protein
MQERPNKSTQLDQSIYEKLSQDGEKTEHERLITQYNEFDKIRLSFEDDGRMIHESLNKVLLTAQEQERTEAEQSKIDKLKAFLELDESALSDIEYTMVDTERALGYSPDESSRFDNCNNDVLVNSAVFYHDRIETLRADTGDFDIDKIFINSVVEYANAVEHDENADMSLRFEDTHRRQEYLANYQRRRSNCHNDMINKLNKLNDLARDRGLKPLTYRNLITNSSVNDFRNNAQMYHDRVTAAHYVSEVIQLSYDMRFPDPKYIKET